MGNIVLEFQVFQETELDDDNFPKNPVLSGRQEKENSSVWLEELCLLNKEAKPKESSEFSLL